MNWIAWAILLVVLIRPAGAATTNDYQEGVSGPANSANVDTQIDQLQPTLNYGVAITAASGDYASAAWAFRELLKFDISGIAAGAIISACTLTINIEANTSPTAGHVYRVLRNWTEGTGNGAATADGATWNTFDGTNNWTTAGCASNGNDYTTTNGVAYSPPGGTGTFTISGLATLAQDALDNRSGILNIILRQDSEATINNLFINTSSDGSTASQRPKLSVTWEMGHRRRFFADFAKPADVAPTDWSPSFVAWWGEEEVDNGIAQANDQTTCGAGTDCDLTDANTVARDATNFVEGIKSANFLAANNEYQTCTNTTCDELDCNGTNNVTWGAWVRVGDLTQLHSIVEPSSGSTTAYHSSVQTSGAFRCRIGDGTDGVNVDTASSVVAANTWVHAVCSFTDSTDKIQPYINGALSGAGGTQQSCADDSDAFIVSSASSTIDMNGQMDELFVTMKALTAAQICRICSVGIDGTYGLCDKTTPANYKGCSVDSDCQTFSPHGKCDTTSSTCQGRNHASAPGCGGCTLPSCNAAGP